MQRSAPHDVPWSLVFAAALASLFILVSLLLELQLTALADERLGRNHRTVLIVRLASLMGSVSNIARMRFPDNQLLSDRGCSAISAGGIMETLLGADLLHLGRIRTLRAPVACIGIAGTFAGIFVSGILPVLLA